MDIWTNGFLCGPFIRIFRHTVPDNRRAYTRSAAVLATLLQFRGIIVAWYLQCDYDAALELKVVNVRMAKKKTSDHASNGRPVSINKTVKLAFRVPENMPAILSNHLVVQSDGPIVLLSFFEAAPPVLLGSEADIREQAAQIDTLTAKCVARIAVPSNRATEFLKVMSSLIGIVESSEEAAK